MKDTDGDLKADTKDLVSDTYGRAAASIEHNANSLFWAMDNVIYTSEHDWHLRLKNGKFETIPTLARGQWGASMDDAGRIFRNVNDAPLFADFVAAKYYARNPNLVRTRGLYEPLISREASVIWPIRRDARRQPRLSRSVLPPRRQLADHPGRRHADRLSRRSAAERAVRRRVHHRLDDQPRHRYKLVDDGTGRMTAVDGYEKGEILASWDERFRPVNMLAGPDGTLYVVDMYRGIVQEQIYWTDFLKDYINAHDLQKPVHLGRIWRIVHDTTKKQPAPALSKAPRRRWWRRSRIRTAGSATRRSSCSCSAATSRWCRS